MRRALTGFLLLLCVAGLVACGPALQAVEAPKVTTPAAPVAPKVFSVGQAVKIGDFRITVTKTRKSTGTQYIKPAAGHTWFIVECVLENMSATTPQSVSSLLMFKLVDADGRSCEWAIFAEAKGKLDGEIGVGRKMTGEVAYEVPVGAKGLELVFTPNPFLQGQAIFALGNL